MSSPIVTIAQEIIERNRIKMKIRVKYVVKKKVRDVKENTRKLRSRRMVK